MIACEDDPFESSFVRFTALPKVKENMSSAAKREGMLWSNGTTRENKLIYLSKRNQTETKQEDENVPAFFKTLTLLAIFLILTL